jgi:hypothetical protein
MSMVFPTRIVKIDLDGDDLPETDITTRVVTSIDTQNGIFGYDNFTRIAEIGYARFSIDNSDNTYSDPSSLIGKIIQVVLEYGYLSKQIFFGHIKHSKIDAGEWGDKRVHLEAYDWMSVASEKVIQNVRLQIDKRIDEAIPALFAETVYDPAHTDFDEGFETFPAVFDGVKKKVTVYSELNKLVNSELGWLYPKFRDFKDGITLRVENYLSRGITTPLSTVPVSVANVGKLKFHGLNGETGYLKQHTTVDSGNIKIHEREDADFGSTMYDADWVSGENAVNDVAVKIYPREYDSSPIVLFNLESPIYIGQTQTRTLNGKFYDPETEVEIPAFDVISPIAPTDYAFNASFFATGTNLTNNLTGSFSYHAGGWRWFVFNKGVPGWLTSLQVRGYGIHKRKPIEYQNQNTQSITSLKESIEQSLTREYSSDYDTSKAFGDHVIAMDRYPSRIMKSASFIANTTDKLMTAYMCLEQGDKVRLVETQPNHTGSYYIQGVKSSIDLGGVVDFQWYLKEGVETYCEPIAIAAPTGTASGVKSALDFGVVPYLANLPAFTYSAWVRRRGSDTQVYIISRSVDVGDGRRGNYFSLNQFGTLTFSSYKTPTDGFWWSPGAFTTQNVWKLCTVTYNNSSEGADPKIYLGEDLLTTEEVISPSGTTDDDSDCPLIIMNVAPDPNTALYQHDNLADVDLKLPRIWNRELTHDEIRMLNRNPSNFDIVQDGLLFQGLYVPRDNRGAYINASITDQDLILDAVHGATAIPYNQLTADIAVLRGREMS